MIASFLPPNNGIQPAYQVRESGVIFNGWHSGGWQAAEAQGVGLPGLSSGLIASSEDLKEVLR